MNPPAANMSVWVGDKVVCIKIAGRANFTSSVDFKTLVNTLWQQGHTRFVLDLTDCVLVDSTFLGVLARFGMNLANARNGDPAPGIELLNANAHIADLLENLGVANLFKLVKGAPLATDNLSPLAPTPGEADRKEVSRTCLEAHQTLMEMNPANVPRFKDVTKFLTEDLKRLEQGEKNLDGEG